MIPPKGFLAERYPLRHRLVFSMGLDVVNETMNTVYLPIVMSSNDMDNEAVGIQVNPHNPAYEEDGGPLVRQMSIIDKLRISLKFNMTEHCLPKNETASGVFSGEGIQSIHFLWRPIFGSFTEKLDAIDDDTAQSVATILGLTHTAAEEDVVPLTTTKLPVQGENLVIPISTVNAVQVFGDFNQTTDMTAEEHVFDEDLLQNALRRFTNKGALRACLGRTRHVTLSSQRPYRNYFLDKFVPRAIRRVMPFTFLGIQVHVPIMSDASQTYHASAPTAARNYIGVSCIANYHEWNSEHDQGMGSQV